MSWEHHDQDGGCQVMANCLYQCYMSLLGELHEDKHI